MILGVPSRPGLRIMVAAKPVDFRKGMDSLAALVMQTLACDLFTGDVFLFRSKRSARLQPNVHRLLDIFPDGMRPH